MLRFHSGSLKSLLRKKWIDLAASNSKTLGARPRCVERRRGRNSSAVSPPDDVCASLLHYSREPFPKATFEASQVSEGPGFSCRIFDALLKMYVKNVSRKKMINFEGLEVLERERGTN